MIRTLNFLILFTTFIVSCQLTKHSQIASPCYYFTLNEDSVSLQTNFENINTDELFLQKNKMLIQVIYYTFDYDSGTDSEYTLVYYSNGKDHSIYKYDSQKQVQLKKEVSSPRGVSILSTIHSLLNEQQLFVDRKCLISGGATGALLIKDISSNSVKYFYQSDGYECDIPGENDKMVKAVELVKQLKRLL